MSGRPGKHADGFQWLKDVITNDGPAYTLVNPDGHWLAHVYLDRDGTWAVVEEPDATTGEGTLLASGLATSGQGLAVVDNRFRPCAWTSPQPEPNCDLDRAPGSIFCPAHTERVAVDQRVSDDMDRAAAAEQEAR